MAKLDNDALKSALEIVSGLQNIENKYGRETLITVLESVGGFFGLVGAFNPESVDKKELEKYMEENRPQENKEVEIKTPGPYDSDRPEEFGMYRRPMEEKYNTQIDTSIYSRNAISKVAEDKQTHLTGNNRNIFSEVPTDENKQTYEPPVDNIPVDENSQIFVEERVEPLTKVLEPNNPWASAGEPVSPGQVFKN